MLGLNWTCFFACTMQCFPDWTFSKQTFQHNGSFSSKRFRYRHEHGRISNCWHGPENILWIESMLPRGVKLMFAFGQWFQKLLELAKTCATYCTRWQILFTYVRPKADEACPLCFATISMGWLYPKCMLCVAQVWNVWRSSSWVDSRHSCARFATASATRPPSKLTWLDQSTAWSTWCVLASHSSFGQALLLNMKSVGVS